MSLLLQSNENQDLVLTAFNKIEQVDYSIDSFIDSNMCKMVVDDILAPKTFMLKNGIFRTFAGNPSQKFLKKLASSFSDFAIVLPSENGWFNFINQCNSFKVEVIMRYSMNSNTLDIEYLNHIDSPSDYTIKQISLSDAKKLSIDPEFNYHLQNFKDAQDFINRGKGYIALRKDTVVGVASSALICDAGIEVNIMVLPSHRGRGIALALGAKLISHVIDNHQNANWDAGNKASKALAEKLGYTMSNSYEALRIEKCANKTKTFN